MSILLSMPDSESVASTLTILVLLILILSVFRITVKSESPGHIINTIDDFNIDCMVVYNKMNDALAKKQIPPQVFVKDKILKEGIGIAGRKYLKISWRSSLCYICAAPFGANYFFSMWTLTTMPLSVWVFMKIPLIGPVIERAYTKTTFYKVDSMTMLHYTVNEVYKDVLAEVTSGKITREQAHANINPRMASPFTR